MSNIELVLCFYCEEEYPEAIVGWTGEDWCCAPCAGRLAVFERLKKEGPVHADGKAYCWWCGKETSPGEIIWADGENKSGWICLDCKAQI